MNAVAPIAEARAVPFRATTFHAFRVCQGIERMKEVPLGGRTHDYGELKADTLEAALAEAVTLPQIVDHKDHLVIRETGERGVKLHVFAIKRKANARYVHANHVTRAVHDLYAAPVCSIDGGILA